MASPSDNGIDDDVKTERVLQNEILDTSSDVNCPKDDFIRHLANDYIHFKIFGNTERTSVPGKIKQKNDLKRNLSCQELDTLERAKEVLRRTSVEMEKDNAEFFETVVQDICPNTAKTSFRTISEEVLSRENLNWGRVVGLFVYGGKLAERFWKSQQEEKVEEVEEWLAEYISQQSEWIERQGGWDNFNSIFSIDDLCWKKWLVKSVLLLGGITLFSYISAKMLR